MWIFTDFCFFVVIYDKCLNILGIWTVIWKNATLGSKKLWWLFYRIMTNHLLNWENNQQMNRWWKSLLEAALNFGLFRICHSFKPCRVTLRFLSSPVCWHYHYADENSAGSSWVEVDPCVGAFAIHLGATTREGHFQNLHPACQSIRGWCS